MERIGCIFTLAVLAFCIASVHSKADNARLQKIKPWDIELENNGYNFLVGISDDIPVSKGRELVAKIQIALRKASEELYRITGRRISFGDVTIVVPNAWDSLGYPLAEGQSVDKGNLYVYTDSLEVQPFNLKYFKGSSSEKGSRSVMIHDGYILKNANDADIGKKIIEQWFTLRFGLENDFSKYATDIEQTDDCLDGSQNSICEGLQEEFTEWSTPGTRSSAQPNFNVVRQRLKRIVVVLDVSGSMAFRMTKARQGIIRYFEHLYDLTLDDKSKAKTLVGAIKFSTNAQPLGNLSFVTSDEFDILGSKISLLEAEEKTSIGAGLLQALNVLNMHPEGRLGAEIILISDGVEDTKPYMNETWDEIIQSKVVVHSIGFSNNADSRVDALGAATGGLTFIHNDQDSGNDLEQAFLSISNYENSDPASAGVVIFSSRLNRTMSDAQHEISVDSLLSKNLTFYFECTLQNCIRPIVITFTMPGNITLKIDENSITGNISDNEYVVNRKLSRIDAEMTVVFFKAKPGIWNLKVERVYGLGTTVTAAPTSAGQYPILAFCFWGIDRIVPNQKTGTQTMNALISRGNNPVTGAKVTATVQYGDKNVNFTLKDDGKDGDLYANDGIYTARFLKKNFNYSGDTRYNLKVKVEGDAATIIQTRLLVAVSPARSRVAALGLDDDVPAFDLQRTSIGGTFMSLKQSPPAYPDAITDLKAEVYDSANGAVILTWSAPWDPFYSRSKKYGTRYQVNYAYTKEDIINSPKQFDSGPFVVEFGSLQAKQEGEQERLAFVVEYSGYEHPMYFTVTTVRPDQEKVVQSEPSNIVKVTFYRCNPACRRGKCIEGVSSCQCDRGFKGKICDQSATGRK